MNEAELFAKAGRLLRISEMYGEVMGSTPNVAGGYQGALKGIIKDRFKYTGSTFVRIAQKYPKLRDEMLDSLTADQIDNVDFYFQRAVEMTIPAGFEDVARIANDVSPKIGERKLKNVNAYRRSNEGLLGAKHYPVPYEFITRQQIKFYFQLSHATYEQSQLKIEQHIKKVGPYMEMDEAVVRCEPHINKWEMLYEAEKHYTLDIRPKS